MAAPYGDGLFVIEPPSGNGLNITDLFHIVKAKPEDPDIYSRVDSKYPNVAIITFDTTNQFGGMWAKEKIDLRMPFSTEIYLYLGRKYGVKNEKLADGMTFTLHNDPNGIDAIGGAGEGLGVCHGRKWTGIEQYTMQHGTYLNNSLVIEFDTYQNVKNSGSFVVDPPGTAHCALLIPRANTIGESDHKNVFTFDPSQKWLKFEAGWTPNQIGGGTLDYTFNGTTQTYTVDDILDTFGGTKVYWGFTGATGRQTSVQAAAITRLPLQGVLAEKKVKNAEGDDIDHGKVLPGDIISYTIRVTAQTICGPIGPIVINDKLSEYVEYAAGPVKLTTSAGGEYTVVSAYANHVVNVMTGQSLAKEGDWLEITFNARIMYETYGTIIQNQAEIIAEGLPEPAETNITEVGVFADPEKKVSDNSAAGKGKSAVKVGDLITYEIGYANTGTTPATINITDTMGDGLDFVYASHNGVPNEADHTVTWNLANVAGGTVSFVSLVVRVNAQAVVKVENYGTITVDGGTPTDTNTTENPVTPVAPVKKVSDGSEAGKNDAAVKDGDSITYEISYRNNSEDSAAVVITDKLPVGVDYVSSNPGGQYDETNHILTWTLPDIASGGGGTVSVVVAVNEKAMTRIVNYATVKVGDGAPRNTNNVINSISGSRCQRKKSTKCRAVIKGTKKWIDDDNIGNTRPGSVDIVLLRDGKVFRSISLDSSGNGKYAFACMPIWKNREQKYEYKVDEPKVPEGYVKTVDGYNVTNRYMIYGY